MIPMIFEQLQELQLTMAFVAGGLSAFLGILQILLWYDETGHIATENLQTGFALLALGVLAAIFGLYLLIPLMVAFGVYLVGVIVYAAKKCL